MMTQVSLWNVALSVEQIRECSNQWFLNKRTGLVFYYPFINTNSMVFDYSGNSIHGHIVGLPSLIVCRILMHHFNVIRSRFVISEVCLGVKKLTLLFLLNLKKQ
jgi:hypothetical protein